MGTGVLTRRDRPRVSAASRAWIHTVALARRGVLPHLPRAARGGAPGWDLRAVAGCEGRARAPPPPQAGLPCPRTPPPPPPPRPPGARPARALLTTPGPRDPNSADARA